MANVGKTMTLGITLPLAALAAKAVQGAKEQAAAMGQVEAALKSMGDASGKTSAELAKTADAMEMRSLFDADVILTKVTANLLTFGNVAGEVFDRAQQAAIDMATRMGSDPQSAAIMLGKALNDPIKGISALSKVGVQLSDAQKKQIEGFVATGQAAKAQGIILTEVERQFAGAAQAAADTEPLRKAEVAWNQAMDKIGEAILPIIPVIADAISDISMAFANLSPEAQKFILAAAGIAAALGPVLFIVGNLVKLAAPLVASLTTASAATAAAGTAAGGASVGFGALAAAAAPWIAAGAAIAAAGYLIYENWDKIAPVLTEVWDAISSTLGPPLQEIIDTISTMLGELWRGPLGDMLRGAIDALIALNKAFWSVFGPALLTVLKTAFTVIATGLKGLLEVGRAVGALFSGDVSGAFQHLWNAINTWFGGLPNKVVGWMSDLVSGVRRWLVDGLNAVWDWVIGRVRAVGDAFYKLYDAVVGHSYIPDMVTEIGQHMRRLDAEMVEPVKKATGKAGEAFRQLQEQVAQILANLFPEQAAQIEYEEKLAALNRYYDTLIKRGGDALAIEKQRLAVVTALRRQYSGWDKYVEEQANAPIEVMPGTGSIEDANGKIMDKVGVIFGKVGTDAEAMKVKVVESFADMVNGAMQELDRFVRGIKSGNWLDIVGGLLSAIQQIGGMFANGGAGGGGFDIGSIFSGGGTPPIAGARAMGGPVYAGRTYLVGENGPELFAPHVSGGIVPNHGLGGVTRLVIEDVTGLFRFRVDERIGEAAPQIAQAGSVVAQQNMQRAGSRRVA